MGQHRYHLLMQEKPENQIEVYMNIKQKAEFKRRYPTLKLPDQLRTYIKPHTFKK